jgi:hypothetical protein
MAFGLGGLEAKSSCRIDIGGFHEYHVPLHTRILLEETGEQMNLFSNRKAARGLLVSTIAPWLVPGTTCVKLSGDFREISQATPRVLSRVTSLPIFHLFTYVICSTGSGWGLRTDPIREPDLHDLLGPQYRAAGRVGSLAGCLAVVQADRPCQVRHASLV